MDKFYNGSSWNKWDLHVHTPISIVQEYGGDTDEVWERYIADLESEENKCKVLGINDYFTLDGFKKVQEYKSKGRLADKIIFPVIELRVKAFGNLGDDPWKRVNLHVIFDNDDIGKIESQFLSQLEIDYNGILKRRGLTKEHIEELGQAVFSDAPTHKKPIGSHLKIGFNNLNFDHRQIDELLKDIGLKHIVAIGKTEWDTLRWDGVAAEKRDITNRAHILFTASKDVAAYNKSADKLLLEQIKNPLLDCSDAHHYSNSTDKNGDLVNERIGNCSNWIKADLTFEGLKQIIFEPSSRICVSQTHPLTPLNQIKSVSFNFPSDTKISLAGSTRSKTVDESKFCISNLHINFSPYFTCLIGGRGSGKSTILNLISERLGCQTDFLAKNTVKVNGVALKPYDYESYIEVNTTCSDIEFISQNQVETFAHENSEQLTQAIYDRLLQSSEDQINEKEASLSSHISEARERIIDLRLYKKKTTEKLELEKQLIDSVRVVDSLDSEDYKSITTKISQLSDRLKKINNAQASYFELLKKLEELYSNYQQNVLSDNQYEIELDKVYSKIRNIFELSVDFSAVNAEKDSLTAELSLSNIMLISYLEGQGISSEDIKDYERAFKQIPFLKEQIAVLKAELFVIKSATNSFFAKTAEFSKSKNDLEGIIEESLRKLNSDLKSQESTNIQEIQFEYKFSNESAMNDLLDGFELTFPEYKPADHSTRKDAIREYLLCVAPENVDTQEGFLEKLDSFGNNTNAKSVIRSLFSDKVNFSSYKILIASIYNDVSKHKRIVGYYAGRELRQCSFGQRCTAVIVALLMFGNKPIIVDEPEAHLDSKLIAEYLVDLIKKRKISRQIIFATHNANLVLNGDAELINVLNVGGDKTTEIVSTSIENIVNRNLLLYLEGNKEAFEKREKKLIG